MQGPEKAKECRHWTGEMNWILLDLGDAWRQPGPGVRMIERGFWDFAQKLYQLLWGTMIQFLIGLFSSNSFGAFSR
jgi:hypothetical protein